MKLKRNFSLEPQNINIIVLTEKREAQAPLRTNNKENFHFLKKKILDSYPESPFRLVNGKRN